MYRTIIEVRHGLCLTDLDSSESWETDSSTSRSDFDDDSSTLSAHLYAGSPMPRSFLIKDISSRYQSREVSANSYCRPQPGAPRLFRSQSRKHRRRTVLFDRPQKNHDHSGGLSRRYAGHRRIGGSGKIVHTCLGDTRRRGRRYCASPGAYQTRPISPKLTGIQSSTPPGRLS